MALRTTDQNIASHRRLVTEGVVSALRDTFGATYNREPQLANLRVTNDHPLTEIEYPCIVVEYEPSRIRNAGVGHEEWFVDANNVFRKWHHSRFEGSVTFSIYGLSTLDRDLLSDALIEVLRFGRLDVQLDKFFIDIYGDPASTTVDLLFSQLMLNVDDIAGGGNSEGLAPWSPEDTLVYSTSHSLEIHGGYYNVIPTQTWQVVTKATASPYEEDVEFTLPFPNPAAAWTNPFVYEDEATVTGTAVISSADSGPAQYGQASYGTAEYSA